MRKSSWILLGLSVVLLALLGFFYLQSQNASDTLTEAQANAMLAKMQNAVAHKNVNAIMDMISPEAETRIANMRTEQVRLLIARAFRQAGPLRADVSGISLRPSHNEATLQFKLDVIHNLGDGSIGNDYSGNITLQLQRVDVPVLLGIFHKKQWRITHAETTGPDPTLYGDY